ncbi:MAG: cytochrome c [Chloroflexi bacterium]|nr:cytochrome c [Chloroflexota bacterium]
MKRNFIKLVGGIMLLMGAVAVLPACASSSGGSTLTPPAEPQPVAQPAQAAPAAPAAAHPAASAAQPANPQPATQPAKTAANDLLAPGKLIFEKTAGGVGCAFCHGLDGKGTGPAGVNAADIRGATESQVRGALQGGVAMMSAVKLDDDEITAVVAYLQTLN